MKRKLTEHPNFIFGMLFIIMFIFHLLTKTGIHDDIYFSEYLIKDIPSFLQMRYETWTSRLLIETSLVFMLNLPKIFWCFLDSLAYVLIAKCITYLFTDKSFKASLIVTLGICILPFFNMSEAGWYATSINYIWPLAAAFIAMLPIKNVLDGKEDSVIKKVGYSLCLLYACNQEQSCALVLGYYTLMLIYLYKNKKQVPYLYFQLFLGIASLIFILTTPGNDLRVIAETTRWYPAYANYNILEKIVLGFLSSFASLHFNHNVIYLLLSGLLIYYTKDEKKLFWKYIAWIPFIMILYVNIFSNYIHNFFPGMASVFQTFQSFTSNLEYFNVFSRPTLILICLTMLVLICILLSLYKIFSKNDLKYFVPILFISGYLSVMILGFSPTIFASGLRTFTFFNYLMVVIITLLLNQKKEKNGWIFLSIFAVLQLISTLLFL